MISPAAALKLECERRSEEHAELHPPELKNFVRLNSTTLDEIRQRKGEPPDAVPSPFPTLNNLCLGAGGRIGPAHGTQLLIAGSSNVGKSHVAYNVAITAMRSAENVAFIALEADMEDIATRLAAAVSGTPIEWRRFSVSASWRHGCSRRVSLSMRRSLHRSKTCSISSTKGAVCLFLSIPSTSLSPFASLFASLFAYGDA